MKNRVVKITIAFCLSVAVFLNCSVFSFAAVLKPVVSYTDSDWYNKYAESGYYPNLPDSFGGFVDNSLYNRKWLSNTDTFDKEEWDFEIGTETYYLSGISAYDSKNFGVFIMYYEDGTYDGYCIPSNCFLHLNSTGDGIIVESVDSSKVTGLPHYLWTDSFSSPKRTYKTGTTTYLYIADYYPDVGDSVFYSSLPIYRYNSGEVFRSADSGLYNNVPIVVESKISFKTFTLNAYVDVSSGYFKPGTHYVIDFPDLGLVYADDPHVTWFRLQCTYLSENENGDLLFPTVDGKTGFYTTVDLYQNPLRNPDYLYRMYYAYDYYDRSFSFDWTCTQSFVDANVKYLWFSFVIRADTPVLLFPGTMSFYDYDSWLDNERWNELNDKLDYVIDGDTGVATPVYDDKLTGAVEEQDKIVDGLYDDLNSMIDECLDGAYASFDLYLQNNVNQLSDNYGSAFVYVKSLFEKIVSVTDVTILILFSLSFGFAIFVLGRRLT